MYLHSRGLFYGKLLLKHLILVVRTNPLVSANKRGSPEELHKQQPEDEDLLGIESDQLNRMSSDEEQEESKQAEISEASDVEIEVFLDGLNLDPLTDLNEMFSDALGNIDLIKQLAPELI